MNSQIKLKNSPKILVAPLDWGLGHVTRCFPIVNELIKQGWEVWIAGNTRGITLMQQEFPEISTLNIEGYNVFYHPSKKGFTTKIIWQLPKIFSRIKREHQWLKRILKEHEFDVVISDNRFGLYNHSAYSIFITHQLHVKSGMGKWADSIIQNINYKYINRFNECWVPDFDGNINMSGELSHEGTIPKNTRFIGILSRFEEIITDKKYELLIILSGPEPSRTNWENKLLKALESYSGSVCLVRGLPEIETSIKPKGQVNIDIVNHLAAKELNLAIEQSEWVVCRSGYTSIMDLIKLRHKAILVPTPGQPEQEYLARYLQQKGIFFTVPETEFSLAESVQQAKNFSFDFSRLPQTDMSYRKIILSLTNRFICRYNYK